MNRCVSRTRTVFEAALLALAQVVAVGCGSSVETSPAHSVAAVESELEKGQSSRLYAAPPDDPILTIAHGMIVLADGTVVQPTPELVRQYQALYIDRLYNQADAQVKADFDLLLTQELPVTGDEFTINAYLIDWLLIKVAPSDAAKLNMTSRFLATATRPDNSKGTLDTRIDYHKQCSAANVPIPPTWDPDPQTSAWTPSGVLKPDFIGAGTRGTVWYWISTPPQPPGLCIALPRAEIDGTIKLLGVICQGKEPGVDNNADGIPDQAGACFWDNARSFHKDDKVEILSMKFNSGPELDQAGQGTCTNCHSGENVFIIHPESALDIDHHVLGPLYPESPTVPKRMFSVETSLVRARTFVAPLVNSKWLPATGPGTELDVTPPDDELSCRDCHSESGEGGRLGKINADYCLVMWNALFNQETKTMPSKAPHLAKFGSPETHRKVIADECRCLAKRLTWPIYEDTEECPVEY